MRGRYEDVVARWGVPPEPVELSAEAEAFLTEKVGRPRQTPARNRADITIDPSKLTPQDQEALVSVVGQDGVDDSADARLAHSGGFSYLDLLDRRGEHPPTPDVVVSPTSAAQVSDVLRVCVERDLALIPFGGGTSVVGGVRPESSQHRAVVSICFDEFAALRNIDDVNMTVTVEPGITGPTLERLLKARGLTLGHLPQSWERASIGGYAATRSSGQASAGYGRSNEMIESLTVVTPIGEFTLGRAPGTAAGPDLRQVFIGSEGIFGVITSVTLRIRRLPRETRYEGVIFPTYDAALNAFRELLARRATADVMRLSDPNETLTNLTMALHGKKGRALWAYLRARKVANGSLAIFSWEGSRTQVGARRDEMWRVMRAFGAVSLGSQVGAGWEKSRFSGPYLRDTLLDNGYLVETLETSTRWRQLPALRRDVYRALEDALGGNGSKVWVMSHLSHVYETGGSLYVTVIANRNDQDAHAQWVAAKTAACDAIAAAGATITHHHAVGRDHAPWMTAEIGQTGVDLLRELKNYFDPSDTLNPGVLVTKAD